MAIFDVATTGQRDRLRRRLHDLGFVHLFNNVMLGRRHNQVGEIQLKLGSRAMGRPARILLLRVSRDTFEQAAWIHRRESP